MARIAVSTTPTKLAPKPTAGSKYLLQNTGSNVVYLAEAARAPAITVGGYQLRPLETWTITGGTRDFWVWVWDGASSMEYGGA